MSLAQQNEINTYTHTHTYIYGTLFSHKKEGGPVLCYNVDEPEGSVLNKISQSHKDMYCMI